MNITPFETAGLTLLESLAAIIAPLAAAKNQRYAPVIQGAATALQAELASIAAGNAPTLHDPAVSQMAASIVAGVGTAALNNTGNATTATLIGATTAAAESAIVAALQPTFPPLSAPAQAAP